MFVERLNAKDLHKFIKENIDETVKSVDLRPSLSKKANRTVALIYTQSKHGKEANYIFIDDKSFSITVSSYSDSKILKKLSGDEINQLWRNYLHAKFGIEYRNFLYPVKEEDFIIL